jgi:Bacterial mobilisation protein (MobC)
MTETPGSASSEETRGGVPAVIYLPDQRQRTKKVTSGSENRQRSTAIRVRVTPADAERLKTEAAAAGTSVAGYLVSGRLTIEATTRPRMNRRPASADIAALTQALVELNRVGNNLNQIARALNELALVAREQGSRRLELRIEALDAAIRDAPDVLAVPLAAIHAALSRDREG